MGFQLAYQANVQWRDLHQVREALRFSVAQIWPMPMDGQLSDKK